MFNNLEEARETLYKMFSDESPCNFPDPGKQNSQERGYQGNPDNIHRKLTPKEASWLTEDKNLNSLDRIVRALILVH